MTIGSTALTGSGLDNNINSISVPSEGAKTFMLYQICAVMYVTIDDHWFNVRIKTVLSAERNGQYIRITLDSAQVDGQPG